MSTDELKPNVPFGSNDVRLSPGEWAVAAALLCLFLILTPRIWAVFVSFKPGPDHRMPYKLSHDYWLYDQYCRALPADTIPILGDSVVWGQYVRAEETLSHYLSRLDLFANLGMDGLHPAALEGLIRFYGRSLQGRKVVLLCNPLWMSSPRADLSDDKEFSFNHPKLVRQFSRNIPCYTETLSGRIGIIAERGLPFFAWANHLRLAYFESTDGPADIPAWTMAHPYAWPLAPVSLRFPGPDEARRFNREHKRKPAIWTGKPQDRQEFPWVAPERSFQWKSFRDTATLLRQRKNTVFVLVGPFNEHMLLEKSLSVYLEWKSHIVSWLKSENLPHFAPPPLPSNLYADASHPIAKGYELLAQELLQNTDFRAVILER